MKQMLLTIGLALALALLFTLPAFAGGWAVITLDELPGQVAAEQLIEIGFMVRQHGVTPMAGLTPVINARLSGSTETVTVSATAQGKTGHYVARFTFPQTGTWDWSIEAFTVNQPMPSLIVIAAAPGSKSSIPTQAPLPSQGVAWLAGILGVAGIVAGLVTTLRKKACWAIALILAGVFVSAGGVVLAAGQPEARPVTTTRPAEASLSQVQLGRELFTAKGCMVCHSHVETNKIREFGVDIGPNLSDYTASPEYLRLWLKSPSKVKPATQMPTLDLSDSEIEALIAFINAK